MRRSPRTVTALGALAAATALLAVVLPPATAGASTEAAASSEAAGTSAVPDAVPRPGALPARLSPAQKARLLADAVDRRDGTARALGLGAKERLAPTSVLKDADGTLHTRYERTYAGLPVLGGDLVVRTGPTGAVQGVNRATSARITVPGTTPSRTAEAANAFALGRAKRTGTKEAKASRAPRAVIWAASGKPVLAWESVVGGRRADGAPSDLHVITNAATGAELYRYDAVKHATGDTQYSGKVRLESTRYGAHHGLVDAGRGGHKTYRTHSHSTQGTLFTDADDIWGDGTSANPQTAAADAAYGARATWDYFEDTHARHGVRDDGDGASTRIVAGAGYGDRSASWSEDCFCAVFGAGSATVKPFTSLDITAHEMAHGVTASTARLVYYGEAGGLAEATSDIFATSIEFANDKSADRGDYLIGEQVDFHGDGRPMRAQDRPARIGGLANYWHAGLGRFDGSNAAGPANHWFYLVSEGSGAKTVNGVAYDSPTVDGLPVTAIGRAAAERIWYRALTRYLTSNSTYADARTATLTAAADLFGANSAVHANVREAWGAVNVGTRSGDPNPPTTPGPVFANNTPLPVPDAPVNGGPGELVSSSVTVTSVPGRAPALLKVTVDASHTGWQSDVALHLVAPDGTQYFLRGNYGLVQPVTYVVDASSETADGTWKLTAQDLYNTDTTRVNNWKLSF
ncbi:M4 family metallopeptidase [Streptomyces sp. NPDC014894]|uniref:M4 family metallopeptidase n=1 Tax=Streptomyces sp. NPDC014894 TaxID=3364931 RepID=UPI00370125DD